MGFRGRHSPSATKPVSSRNSRLAASSGSSPGSNSPLGIDHAPSSLFTQNGPPGCTKNTSREPHLFRYNSRPALSLGIAVISTALLRRRSGEPSLNLENTKSERHPPHPSSH